jgi:Rad3-related DNA helicase
MIPFPSPKQLGLPYDDWRPGQYEAVQSIRNSAKKVTLLDAPCGSGKSGIAVALGSRGESVRALTFTRGLQAQYGRDYSSVEVLYGLNNYDCDFLQGVFRADSCVFAHDMLSCPSAARGRCEYIVQRDKTRAAQRQALSYQYFFKASWHKKDNAAVTHLYADEAHHLPQAIMSHMTYEMSPATLSKFGLDPLPNMPEPQVVRKMLVLGWMEVILNKLDEEIVYLTTLQTLSQNKLFRLKAALNIQSSTKLVYNAYNENQDDFFIHMTPEGVLQIFPLTPAPFFWSLFDTHDDTHITLASATMGNHKEFAQLLGIGAGNWESHIVPPVFPPEAQPVYYYGDAPRMSHKSGDSAYGKQVELMRNIIDQFPPDANGLIHFVSIETAKRFGDMLSFRYGDRIWMPDVRHTTEQKLEAWELQKKKQPGTICLSWSFSTGVDAWDVSFNIVQKTPFLPMDTVGKEIMNRNKRLYGWIAGVTIEQACGRIRRGHPSHYEEAGQPLRKHVSILDNNFRIVKKYFSSHFTDCLTKV